MKKFGYKTLELLDECTEIALKNELVNIVSLLMQMKNERFSLDAVETHGDKKVAIQKTMPKKKRSPSRPNEADLFTRIIKRKEDLERKLK